MVILLGGGAFKGLRLDVHGIDRERGHFFYCVSVAGRIASDDRFSVRMCDKNGTM